MARGWESKSVDEQMADKLSQPKAFSTPPLTPLDQERASLLLQRKRILLAIEQSGNPRYIQQQNMALAHLDLKLNALPSTSDELARDGSGSGH